MMKSGDVSRDIFSAIVVRNEAFIPRAGQVDHLQRRTLQEWQRFDQRLIDSARTLAPSHHEQRREIFVQLKLLARNLPVQTHQFGPDRRAGDFGVRFWKKGRALPEA